MNRQSESGTEDSRFVPTAQVGFAKAVVAQLGHVHDDVTESQGQSLTFRFPLGVAARHHNAALVASEGESRRSGALLTVANSASTLAITLSIFG